MKTSALNILAAMLLLGACSSGSGSEQSPGGESKEMAGGQSGTDGAGSYSCNLEHHTETDIPLDQSIHSFQPCSAEIAVSRLPSAAGFDCGALGEFNLSVGAATAARELTGVMYNDTGDPGPGAPCYSLAVDVPIHITSTERNVPLDAPGFVVGHLCDDFLIQTDSDDAGQQQRFVIFPRTSGADLLVWADGQGWVRCDPKLAE
jgi:hypothetical protein